MMSSYSKTVVIIFIVGFALAGLIGVQIFWAYHAYHLTEKEFASDVKEAMKKTVDEINTRITCFETFSKVRINTNEGFYMIRQKCDRDKFLDASQNPPDTIPMFYDTDNDDYFKWNNIMFSKPINVSMVFQFQYIPDDYDSSLVFGNTFEKITHQNFRDAFSDHKPIEARYSPEAVDSALKINMSSFGIDEKYHFAYLNDSTNKISYLYKNKDSLALQKSSFRILLTPSKYFSRPYDLSLVFDNYSEMILASIRKLLITSILIISILLISFYLFVRIILRQRRLSELKNDFINNMTHEFKTPLTNISLAIENFSEKKLSTSKPHDGLMKIIGQETERLRENVERILQIARFEKEKLHLTIDQIEVHQLIRKVVSAFDSIFPEDGIIFHCNFWASNSILHVDETHLFNVVYNLVDNGVKYNLNKPEIEISTRDFKEGILITIKDNGIGISANNQKKIFEKFFRITGGNLHDVKGYGLGLSYIKLVMDSHHGYITVKSQQGHGSEFEIYLPNQA
jgi:two-component system phosphate regulon sensor histidine kinase PhoR